MSVPNWLRQLMPRGILTWPPRTGRRVPGLTLRSQLTLLYAGFLLAAGAAVLAVPIFTIRTALPAGASAAIIAAADASTRAQQVRAVIVLAVLVVVAFAVGWLIAGRLLRPLRSITATAREISATNLGRRLDARSGGNEFGELGDTLNDLFGRLEASFESQRRFIANASHELRTPLAAGRALLQVALADPDTSADSLRATCEEVLVLGDRQERLIGSLLTLAVSQRGLTRSEPLDLAEISRAVLLARRDEAERRGIAVRSNLRPAPIAGDPSLAESLVANLVDNAIRHNLPGGQAEASTGTDAGGTVLSVVSTGPLIDPAQVEGLFEPFRQLGTERVANAGGTGLGLAIVRAIAAAHGGAVSARARPEGGLDVTVRLPQAG
ncbi:MAG: sensor histidine kinase [Streptosporangiaceae bacterium]